MNKKQLIGTSISVLSILCCSNICARSFEEDMEKWDEEAEIHFQSVQRDMGKYLAEANAKFTYAGKPIHPGLVEEFSGWMSDSGPITVSVDVSAAYGTNEYYEDEVKIADNGNIAIYRKDSSYFCYRWLGRLDNGLHVLYVEEGGGGGSGIFEDLNFVRFDIGEGINSDNKKYKRLLMTIVRTYVLGDRDDGKIEVLKDRVIVGKSRYRNEPVMLGFDKEGIK